MSDCEVVCARDGGCEGNVKSYHVSKLGDDWRLFLYCEKAVKRDREMGFTVADAIIFEDE